jgi:hypothetical protein
MGDQKVNNLFVNLFVNIAAAIGIESIANVAHRSDQ